MENNNIQFFKTDDFITLIWPNEAASRTIFKSENPTAYKRASYLISAGRYDELADVTDDWNVILTSIQWPNDVQYRDGMLLYKGAPIHNVLSKKILEKIKSGDTDVDPEVNFLESCLRNPSHIAVDDLYLFLTNHESVPITEDGAVLMYKKVRDDFTSYFTGKDGKHVDWSPGTVVTMDRADCDPDRDRTCSSGLHTCTRDYLPFFYGNEGRVILVKVFPEDITSIPAEYGHQKCRSCRAESIREIRDLREFAFGAHAYDAEGNPREVEEEFGNGIFDEEIIAAAESAIARFIKYSDTYEDWLEEGVIVTIEEFVSAVDDYVSDFNERFVYDPDWVAHVIDESANPLFEDLQLFVNVSVSVKIGNGDEADDEDFYYENETW